jgi:hypothetical protein
MRLGRIVMDEKGAGRYVGLDEAIAPGGGRRPMGCELAPESDLDAFDELWIVAPAQAGEHAGQVVRFQASPVAIVR